MDDLERPLCKCHGEPMLKDGIRHRDHGVPCWPHQEWRCRIKKRASVQKYFEGLSGVEWSKRLNQMRRANAMYRRREREQREVGE